MKPMLDTNIVIDYFCKREPFFQSALGVFSAAAERDFECIIGASAITDIYYLCRRHYKNDKDPHKVIADLLRLVTPVDTRVCDIQTAFTLAIADFEDAVLAATAQREEADCIITRNVSDFASSPVRAITPDDFLKELEGVTT